MKKLKLLPVTLLLLTLGLAGCGNREGGSSQGGGGGNTTQSEQSDSPIKSLVATVEHVDLKKDEATSVSSYYKLTGFKTLTSKEKKVTITSSDTSVVKIVGNIMTGLTANGTATITITSQADTTKSCSFTVLVKDIFFNRAWSEINGGDDLEKELPADGGIVQTTGGVSDMLIFNQQPSKSFMMSTKIAVNRVSDGELWPKFGVVMKQVDEAGDLGENFVVFFLDGPMNRVEDGVAKWTDFGYCEVMNSGGLWGWDSTPAMNRHKENVFIKDAPIGYDEFFTLTAVVQGRKINMFLGYGEGESAKEVYMFTLDGYEDLFGHGEGNGFVPGLFHFNSVVTFKDYTYTTDAAAISAKMEGVTERLADYDGGGHTGESYHETEPTD